MVILFNLINKLEDILMDLTKNLDIVLNNNLIHHPSS